MSWGNFKFAPDVVSLAPEFNPELRARLLAFLEAAGQSRLAQIAEHMELGQRHVLSWLELLQQQGHARAIYVKNRAQWTSAQVEIDTYLVRDEYRPVILAALIGRREMATGLARVLNLPFEEVRETLKAMQQAGEVIGAPLGASTIYALEVREQSHISLERVQQLPMSPRAQMLHALTLLPPETLRFARRPAAETKVKAPKPRATRAMKLPKPPKPPRDMKPLVQAARAAKVGVRQARALANKGRVRNSGKGEALLVNVEDLRLKKAGLRGAKKQPAKVKRQIVKKAAEAIKVQDGYQHASEAARSINVRPMALLKWLSNHDEGMKHCYREGKYLMVSQTALRLYLQAITIAGAPEQVRDIPEGWPIIWDAVERVGWSYCKLYKMLQAGELQAVRVGGKLYFDPVTLDALKVRLDAEFQIPEGWINVRWLCKELGGLDRSSVTSWMARNGFEGKKYRDPERQLAMYYPPAALEAYRAHRDRCPGGIKVNAAIAREIRLAVPPIPEGSVRRDVGVVAGIAEQYGVSPALVHNILRGSAYPEASD